MLRQGSGEPLLLLHGVLGGHGMWRHVVPRIAPFHDVIAPSALGHRGGRPAALRPARLAHVIDDAERLLDELGLQQVHVAGNSMGGWVALELARRGRARSVCAFSPAGMWEPSPAQRSQRPVQVLRATLQTARLGKAFVPLLSYAPRFRAWALRQSAADGQQVSREDFLELTRDLLGCHIADDLLATEEHLPSLHPPPCPITVVWSGLDRVFPVKHYGPRAKALLPGARFVELAGVGHVPMLDAPERIAAMILESARLARSSEDAAADAVDSESAKKRPYRC